MNIFNFNVFKIAIFYFVAHVVVAGFNIFDIYNTHKEPLSEFDDLKSSIRPEVKEKWMKQKLDHLNEQDSREWMMRYLVNDEFYQPGECKLIVKKCLTNFESQRWSNLRFRWWRVGNHSGLDFRRFDRRHGKRFERNFVLCRAQILWEESTNT